MKMLKSLLLALALLAWLPAAVPSAPQQALVSLKASSFPAGTATWNPSDKAGTVTLSNGDLTAAVGNPGIVRSTVGKSSGKWYVEVRADGGTNPDAIGIATGSHSVNTDLGYSTSSYAYFNDGRYVTNSALTAYGSSWTIGDTIGIALDMTGNTVTFYKNNVSQGAISIAADTWYIAVGALNNNGTYTLNAGGSTMAYSPPAGFTAGMY